MNKHLVSVTALCAALFVAGADMNKAGAEGSADASMIWLEEEYPYSVVDQALSDVFTEFGHNLGVSVETSRHVGGKRVHSYSHDGSADEFLSYLVAEHDLDWIADNGRLFISAADERITRSWSGDASSMQGAKAALVKAGIDDPRYQIGIGSDQGVLSLTAPPRYMAQAAPVIESAMAPKSTQTVTVIHGRARSGGGT
ncbi:MAG: hypothetical protein ACR2RA_19965 [Geminicoccaceae bacterium]